MIGFGKSAGKTEKFNEWENGSTEKWGERKEGQEM